MKGGGRHRKGEGRKGDLEGYLMKIEIVEGVGVGVLRVGTEGESRNLGF